MKMRKKAKPKEKVKQRHYFMLETVKTTLTRAEVALFQNVIEQTLRKTGFTGDVKYMGYLTSPAESWEG